MRLIYHFRALTTYVGLGLLVGYDGSLTKNIGGTLVAFTVHEVGKRR